MADIKKEIKADENKTNSYISIKGYTFFIIAKDVGDFKAYHLIKFDNFSMIDMFFVCEEDSKVYAKKKETQNQKLYGIEHVFIS